MFSHVLGSGNIVQDMSNQVKANSIRISVLNQQNHGLTKSIQKIKAMTQETDTEVSELLVFKIEIIRPKYFIFNILFSIL